MNVYVLVFTSICISLPSSFVDSSSSDDVSDFMDWQIEPNSRFSGVFWYGIYVKTKIKTKTNIKNTAQYSWGANKQKTDVWILSLKVNHLGSNQITAANGSGFDEAVWIYANWIGQPFRILHAFLWYSWAHESCCISQVAVRNLIAHIDESISRKS